MIPHLILSFDALLLLISQNALYPFNLELVEEGGLLDDADPGVGPPDRHVGRDDGPDIRLGVVHL